MCLWSDQSDVMTLFYGFNLWGVPCFIFLSPEFFSNFSVAPFVLLPVDFICYQAHIVNKLTVSMVPRD
jgi:hypothetical protein